MTGDFSPLDHSFALDPTYGSKVGVVKTLPLADRNTNWNDEYGALNAKESNVMTNLGVCVAF